MTREEQQKNEKDELIAFSDIKTNHSLELYIFIMSLDRTGCMGNVFDTD